MSDKITMGEDDQQGSSGGRHADRGRATVTRRSLLKTVGVGLGIAAFGTSVSSVTADEQDQWSIVVLPDTQKYTETQKYTDDNQLDKYLNEQTDWISENVDSENIVFVSHVGDLVEEGDDTSHWDEIDDAMSTLDGDLDANPDGLVPYATVPGNHDWADTWDRSSSIENYLSYFGKSRYDGRSWYGGTGPSEDDTNSYQLFSAGGYDFLHLALEWEPPDTSLEWGQSILDEHPEKPTILTTHSYLNNKTEQRHDELQEENKNGNTAQTVWEELVTQNSQIFMVLGGHWHEDDDGEYHQVSTNAAGQPVYEILTNYQDLPNGGNGWLRQMKFIEGGGSDSDAPDRIQARTHSPYLAETEDDYEPMTDADSEFSFDLDFDARFTELTPDSSFQWGVDGYEGTVDTNLREADPTKEYGSAETVTVDTNQPQGSGNHTQALLRFDGIIGSETGQIPLGSTIERATLTLNTVDDGSGGAFHRMLIDWDDTATWESFGGGIEADDNEALSTADVAVENVQEGTTTIDVTPTVQAWANGDANFGWAILPLGEDGWDFETAEGETPPRLTVDYQFVAGDADDDGDVDEDDLELVQRDIANYDVDIDRQAADMDDDGDVDIGDAMSIRNKIGGGE